MAIEIQAKNPTIQMGIPGPRGERGPKGDPFTYDDFTPEQLEQLKGPKGDPFTYNDFTPEQLESLKGPKGDKGDAFTYDDFTAEQLEQLKGPKGDPGPTYTAGENITISADNVISATGGGEPDAYIKEASVSGNTLTLTKKDNSTVAFTPEGGSGLQNLSDGTGEGSVQGFGGSATGRGSFCMGYNTQTKAYSSLVFGYSSFTSEQSNFGIALGDTNKNDGQRTVSIGSVNQANGNNSIAIGRSNKAYSRYGKYSGSNIAIGENCKAGVIVETGEVRGTYCIATGEGTCSAGSSSFTEGSGTKAYGAYGSHSEGRGTISTHMAQHAQGTYNIKDTSTEEWYNKGTYADIVGNGNSDTERSNAYTLDWAGNGTFSGTVSSATGADYAEYFEWKDGNPDNEDRVGYIVALDGNKIVKADSDDDILGICSGTAMVLGDSAEWNWAGRYLTDEFGRIIYEDYNINHEEKKDEDGSIIEDAWVEHIHTPKINPSYDDTKVYKNRGERPEWQIVGMMGKIYVRDDGTCEVNKYAKVSNGIATNSNEKTNMRVMERVSQNVIRVLLK